MLITHLPLVVLMFAQWFYIMQNFTYAKFINNGEQHVINIATMARQWAI
jgi:hypothetical protein